jgi:hypothetical protein
MRRRFFRFGFGMPRFGFFYYFGPGFPRRREYLEMLEDYRQELEAELREVEREIAELKADLGRET